MQHRIILLVLATLLWSCGGTEGDGAGELTDRSQYPPGPYGKTVGSVLENLSFQRADGSAFTLNDVFADEKNRVLLITTTAGWCGACLEEQPRLVQLYNRLSGRGLEIVAALFEDANSEPATLQQLAAWQDEYDLPYPIVLDAPFVLGAYYDSSATPMNMVVDVDTMEILLLTTGFDESLVTAVIEDNLPR